MLIRCHVEYATEREEYHAGEEYEVTEERARQLLAEGQGAWFSRVAPPIEAAVRSAPEQAMRPRARKRTA